MAKKKNIDDEILGEDKEKEEEKNNKQMDMESIRKLINKEAGKTIAFNLENEDPTTVKKWIKTGSRVLDSIISRGMYSGVPVGRIVELAGLESSGKSFVAAGICKNAIENGFKVAYFDSESAIDKNFWNKIGIDTNEILYLQAISIESVLETIEKLISLGQPFLYVLDSLANCASKKRLDTEGFDPQAIMAMDARILSQGFKKLTIPLANAESTFLVLNQLKFKIPAPMFGNPYFTAGGKALQYAASLRIWLTASKSNKDGLIKDENGDILGTSVTAKIEKSRFGSVGRTCDFDIKWVGDNVGIQDEQSWYDIIKSSKKLKIGGAGWNILTMEDNSEIKFQGEKGFLEEMKNESFKNYVIKLMDEILIK